MVFNTSGISLEKVVVGAVLGYVAVVLLNSLVPLVIDALINMTTTVFGGTVFAPIFANGLVWYGLLLIAVITFGFKLLGIRSNM